MIEFTPLKDFTEVFVTVPGRKPVECCYCVGLNYTVRPLTYDEVWGDPKTTLTLKPEETPLYGQLQKWLQEGKVRLGTASADNDPALNTVRASGAGPVSGQASGQGEVK